nr:uncharacterized protein LOC106677331 isoform X3 [Halyomorpha halys]
MLPQKKYYRQRAHTNPIADHSISYPRSPAVVDWRGLFPNYFPINGKDSVEKKVEFLDVGCGYGGLLVKLSTMFPDSLAIGMEIRIKVCDYVKDRIEALRIQHPGKYQNIACIRTNAMKYMPNYFCKGQLKKMFFLYPDPHFKKSKHKWRIISPTLLAEYAYVLAIGAVVYTVTDVEDLHQWIVKHLSEHPLFMRLTDSELVGDPVIDILLDSSEEGQKVTRNNGSKFLAIFKRIEDKRNTVSLNTKELHSFRCLLEDTFEPCIVFPETSSHNVTVFSHKLINEYGNLSADIHDAFEQQNLTLISEANLEKLPDSILLLLPVNHLSSVNPNYLLNLIIQRSRSSVVKHLVKAYLLGDGDDYFYGKLQTVDLPVRSLTWIADVISSDTYGAKKIMNDPPLLFYSPPFSLLFNNTSQKLFYLSLWERSNHISKNINKSYLRFWAYATLKSSFPGSLNHWNDLCLERWGTLLTVSTSDELKLLNNSNIDNLQLLFSFGFSTIQMRTIFEEFSERLMNSGLDYFTLSNLLIHLLPEQLLLFSKIVPYIEELKVLPSIKSISSSKQIFELLLFEKKVSDAVGYPYSSNFSYVVPLKTLSNTLKHPVPLSNLIKIQSNHFSKHQLYILSSRSKVFDFNSEYIFECKDLIKVLPARDIIFNQTASHVLLHLVSEVTADNIPQTFSVFNKLWNMLGSSNVFKKILDNRSSNLLLEYIPSRFIANFADSILILIGASVNSYTKLPDSFVSSLLVSLSDAEKNFNLLNANESLAFLFNGISCDDISSLDPYDFVVFISKFTEQRKASGKDFPKTLQQCCVEKFFAYIELKSSLFQRVLGESKLSLLNEAEIDSIGGYIFSALPTKPIAKAKYSKRIVKSIGKLSLSELIMAAPISRLQEFATVLIHDGFNASKKIDFALFDLGNLTLFLDKKYISKINETYFQLSLESSYIDRRVCINKSSRLAWFKHLKQCFGETSKWTYQTLVTLGDLLIVVPNEELDKIPSNSWKYAVDVLILHYNDIVKYSSSLKFYEICMLQLNSEEEAQWFYTDLKHLIKVFLDAAQLQLSTVTTAQELEKKKKSSDGIFTFINSRKSNIKISIPSIKNLINTEKPIMKNEKVLQVTETTVNNGCRNSTGCQNYFSEERTLNYFVSTSETPVGENTYPIYNKNSTAKEIYKNIAPDIEQPKVTSQSTNEVNMSSSEETSTFFNIYEKYFNLTTPLDDITYSKLSNSVTTDGKSSSVYRYDFKINRDYFTAKDHSDYVMQSSTSTLQNQQKLTTSAIELPSEIYNNVYNFYSSDSRIDKNGSLTKFNSVITSNNFKTMDINQTDVYTPINSKELVTESSHHISKMSSTPISTPFDQKMNNKFKVIEDAQFENLLKNNNTNTEFLKLNFSSLGSKLTKNSYVVVGSTRRERVKRTIGQFSCDALKMIGKSAEILISEELIKTMSEEDLTECVDLFSEMDIPMKVKNLIWNKLDLDLIFLYGKLVSAINIYDVENMNFSLSVPWALETIYLIGKYSSNPEVKKHVINSIISTRKQRYTLEILVTLGSLICELPEISPQLIEPSEFLKASLILGRSLPCNYSCLQKLSNIAVKEGAFEDPSKWNSRDVSDLGIIIAGLERAHWKKLLHSKKKPLRGISEQAFKCLSREYIEELELLCTVNLSKIFWIIQTYLTDLSIFNLDKPIIQKCLHQILTFDLYTHCLIQANLKLSYRIDWFLK